MDEREPPEIDAEPNSYRDNVRFRREPVFHPGGIMRVLQFFVTLAALLVLAWVVRTFVPPIFR